MPAVGGIIIRKGQVVLVKRGVEPSLGRWSIPGGAIELGEDAQDALRREVLEETGLEVEPVEVIDVFDNIVRSKGHIQFHYTLIDYLCRYLSGKLTAGSDVTETQWVPVERLGDFDTTANARRAIAKAMVLCEKRDDWE